MIKSFMSLRNTVVALGVVALLLAVFTVKLIAGWDGQIGDTQTITLDPSQCAGGSGGAGPCYKTLTCAPAADKCSCTEEGDWH